MCLLHARQATVVLSRLDATTLETGMTLQEALLPRHYLTVCTSLGNPRPVRGDLSMPQCKALEAHQWREELESSAEFIGRLPTKARSALAPETLSNTEGGTST